MIKETNKKTLTHIQSIEAINFKAIELKKEACLHKSLVLFITQKNIFLDKEIGGMQHIDFLWGHP